MTFAFPVRSSHGNSYAAAVGALEFPGRGTVQRTGDAVELLRDASRVQPRFATLLRAAVAGIPGVASVEVPATLKSLGRIVEKAALDPYAGGNGSGSKTSSGGGGGGEGGDDDGGGGGEEISSVNSLVPLPPQKQASMSVSPLSPRQSQASAPQIQATMSIAEVIMGPNVDQRQKYLQQHREEEERADTAVAEGGVEEEEEEGQGEQEGESPAGAGLPDSLYSSRSNVCRVFDVVRAMVVCNNLRAAAAVVRRLGGHPDVCLVRIKERFFQAPSDGGWRDCMLCFYLHGTTSSSNNTTTNTNDADRNDSRHICEVQVVHKSLLTARKGACRCERPSILRPVRKSCQASACGWRADGLVLRAVSQTLDGLK
jgi:hypothetical protein